MRPHHDAGTTLVEIVVAIMVFTLMATGSLTAVTGGLRLISDARLRATASNLASEEIDRVHATNEPLRSMTGRKEWDVSASGASFHVVRQGAWRSTSHPAATCYTANWPDHGQRTDGLRLQLVVTWRSTTGATSELATDSFVASSTGGDRTRLLTLVKDPITGTSLPGQAVQIRQGGLPGYTPQPERLNWWDVGDRDCVIVPFVDAGTNVYVSNKHRTSLDSAWTGVNLLSPYSRVAGRPGGPPAPTQFGAFDYVRVQGRGSVTTVVEMGVAPAGVLRVVSETGEDALLPTRADVLTIRTPSHTFGPTHVATDTLDVRAYADQAILLPASTENDFAVEYHAPGCEPVGAGKFETFLPGEVRRMPLAGAGTVRVEMARADAGTGGYLQQISVVPEGGTGGSVGACRSAVDTSYMLFDRPGRYWERDTELIALPPGTWRITQGAVKPFVVTIPDPGAR